MAGHIVRLTEGGFTLGGSVVIPGDNRTLEGSGLATTLTLANSVNDDAIKSTATRTGIVLRAFVLDGNMNNQTSGRGIYGLRWGQSLIERVTVKNTYSHGIYMNYPTSANARLTVRRCSLENIGRGGVVSPTGMAITVDGNFRDVTLEHNYIDNPYEHAIFFNTAGGTCNRVKIFKNTILLHRSETVDVAGQLVTPGSCGVVFNNSTGSLEVAEVEQNVILRTQTQRTATPYQALFGIWIAMDANTDSLWTTEKQINHNFVGSLVYNTRTSGDGIAVQGDNVTMKGNTCRDINIGDGFVLGGIATIGAYSWVLVGNKAFNNGGLGFLVGGGTVYGLQRAIIEANHAVANGRDGFLFYGTNYCTIVGNHSRSNTESGIAFDNGVAASDRNLVVGNSLNGNTRYGLEEIGGSDANRIFNNQMEGNTLGPMLIVGPNTITRDNPTYNTEGQIEHHTAADTLTVAEKGSVHTNLSAAGVVTLTLPQSVVAGFWLEFVVMAAQALRIDPGAAGAVYINGAKQTDDKYIWADDEAESVKLVADGNGDWVAVGAVGTWGVEA